MDNNRIVITGIGAVAGNGSNKYEFFENCCNGTSGFKECSLFDVSKFSTKYAGQIEGDYPYLPEKPCAKSRMSFIAEKCIEEMFEDAKLTKETIAEMKNRAYLSFSTSLWSIEKILQYVKFKNKGEIREEWLNNIPKILPEIKKLTGVEGGCYTVTTACTSSSNAVGIGFDLIKHGKADLVIVGGVDSLSEFSFYGFNSLRAFSKSKCKPFDKQRDGINIGEGGAFLVLESLENAKKRNAKIYSEILGYGINNDAYHVTSPDPNGKGAFLSMEMALKESNKNSGDIDYVNTHGTGTILNDTMELNAMQRLFQFADKKVPVSSTKSLIGHCLAAAGILELVVAVLSLEKGICVKNVNLQDKIEGYPNVDLITENKAQKINYAFSNNFAFAGNTSSILVGAYNS